MRLIFVLAVSAVIGSAALAQDAQPIAPMDVDPALAELGKRMFYDTRLSGDTTLACASCRASSSVSAEPGETTFATSSS